MTATGTAAQAEPERRGKELYIAWIGFQRRAESMRQILGFDLRYVPPPFAAKPLKPLGYLLQTIRTAAILLGTRPQRVWLQSPPGFLPHLALLLRPLAGGYEILLDGHDAAYSPPWSRFPGSVWAMNRCDGVLVHNEAMRAVVEALGIEPARIRLLEDPPALVAPAEPRTEADDPYVLVPCSFGADEQDLVPAVLGAARLLPAVRFKITGRRRKAEALGLTRDAPDNVTFTDYLATAEFEALLARAGAVLGITRRENCQLSVASEALGAEVPLVLSDTPVLRRMFGEAALFAENRADSFAAALDAALARRDELAARSAALKRRRQSSWSAAAQAASQTPR